MVVKLDRIEHTVEIPEGVTATLDGDMITISGPNGSISREFSSPRHDIFQEGGALLVRVDMPRVKEKALAGTWNAHLKHGKGSHRGLHLHFESSIFSLPYDC